MHVARLSPLLLAGVFVIMSAPGGAHAESQAGGVPALAERVTVLEGVTTTLKTTVTTLQTQVTTLRTTVTTLQDSNADLRSALAAEIAARETAEGALRATDDELRSLIFQLALRDIDFAIRIKNLEDDVAANAGASGKFFQIRHATGGLVNGARATIATLGPLPPGNYLVIGRVDVVNFDHDALWSCSLQHPSEQQSIDGAETSTQSVGLSGSPLASITMAGIARLTVSDPVTMDCESNRNSSDLGNIHLIAVQIGLPG